MAPVAYLQDHNPLVGAKPNSIPTDTAMRFFARWVEAREKRRTPVTDWMPRRKGDLWDQIKIETGQSYTPNITTAVKVQWANNSGVVDVVDTSLIRQGDVLEIIPFYTGSTTEFNYSMKEYALVYSVTDADTLVVERHHGQGVSSGAYATHAINTVVRVISRAQNYNTPFLDAPTWKGDIIYTHPMRFDSGEITYDTAAVVTPTYENNRQMKKDIADWTMRLKLYREQMLMKGRRVTGDYTSNPKKPYMMGGMIWWAEQNSANINNIGGRQLTMYDLDDSLREKWDSHDLGPGTKVFIGPLTLACLDSFLNPYRQGTLNDTSMTNRVDNLKFRWADLDLEPTVGWPEGTILITSKDDWEWGNYVDHDWKFIERGPEELGAPQVSWSMYGDFSMVCKDYQRQVLLTNIDTRIDLYPGRKTFGGVAV